MEKSDGGVGCFYKKEQHLEIAKSSRRVQAHWCKMVLEIEEESIGGSGEAQDEVGGERVYPKIQN